MKYVRMLYYIIANSLVLLVFVLVVTHCLILIRDLVRASPDEYRYLSDVVKNNYRHVKPVDVDALLKAHASYSMKYAPRVGYREAPFKSRFLNIDEYGIRSNGKSIAGIEKINNAIWFFGGSTTWGGGVADEETIPAQLEKAIGRRVVNFGVNAFYSEQENLELVEYLRLGYRPSIAVFLDGINESCEMLLYQDQMELIFAKAQEGYRWDPAEIAKPVVHAFGRLSSKLEKLQEAATDSPASKLTCERYGKRQALSALHADIMKERDSLCRLYALQCITFVQPFAGVHGRHEDRNSLGDQDRQQLAAKFEHLEPNWRNARAIFVTDALDRLEKHAYIDDIHYSVEANGLIARAIATHLATSRR